MLGNAGIAGLNLSDLLTGNAPFVEMGDIKMIRLFVILMLVMGSVDAASFRVASDGPVMAYFVGASAAYENRMTANFDGPTADAPFISNRSSFGDSFSYGSHAAGEQVIFVNNVLDTGNWFYSLNEFNDDGFNHIFASQFSLPDGTPAVFIGFEDIYGLGDRDFNDNMAIFTNVTMVPIPEPSTYAMLLVGLGLIGFTMRRAK